MMRNDRVVDTTVVESDDLLRVHQWEDICEAGSYLEQVCVFCNQTRLIWLG